MAPAMPVTFAALILDDVCALFTRFPQCFIPSPRGGHSGRQDCGFHRKLTCPRIAPPAFHQLPEGIVTLQDAALIFLPRWRNTLSHPQRPCAWTSRGRRIALRYYSPLISPAAVVPAVGSSQVNVRVLSFSSILRASLFDRLAPGQRFQVSLQVVHGPPHV